MAESSPVDQPTGPEFDMRGRVLGDPHWNIICLKIIGRALDGGVIDARGTIRNSKVPDTDIRTAIDSIHRALAQAPLAVKCAELFKVVVAYPMKALLDVSDQLKKIPDAYGKERMPEELALDPEYEPVSQSVYGQTLQENAELVVLDPDSVDAVSRKILMSDIDVAPDVGCVDGPWLPYVVIQIRNRVQASLRGRRFWRFALLVQGEFAMFAMLVGFISGNDFVLGIATLLLALLGCGLNGYLQEHLLHGFDKRVLATAKTWAKIPSVLAVVSALMTTLIFRDGIQVVGLVAAVIASILLAIAGLCADCLINHAEAATK